MEVVLVAIKWHDVNDKDITDASKYAPMNENWKVADISVLNDMQFDEEVEIFIKRNSNEYPPEDQRLVIVSSAYGPTNKQDSQYPDYRVWDKIYTITERTKEDKKGSIDQCLYNANAQVYPTEKRAQYDDIYSVALRKKQDGIELTAIEKDIMSKKELYASAMVDNISIANSKKAAIDSNIPVDLDSDWKFTIPTNA